MVQLRGPELLKYSRLGEVEESPKAFRGLALHPLLKMLPRLVKALLGALLQLLLAFCRALPQEHTTFQGKGGDAHAVKHLPPVVIAACVDKRLKGASGRNIFYDLRRLVYLKM